MLVVVVVHGCAVWMVDHRSCALLVLKSPFSLSLSTLPIQLQHKGRRSEHVLHNTAKQALRPQ